MYVSAQNQKEQNMLPEGASVPVLLVIKWESFFSRAIAKSSPSLLLFILAVCKPTSALAI